MWRAGGGSRFVAVRAAAGRRESGSKLPHSKTARVRAWLCGVVLVAGVGVCAVRPVGAAALAVGEAEYGVSWNGIPAGSATIAVHHDRNGAQPMYRVEALARTNWLVDLLWHFRGHAMSSFTSDSLVPLGYRYDREENSKHIVTDVIFDYSAPSATGVEYRGNEKKVIELQQVAVLDPITAIFQALARPVHVGEVLPYEVFTGEARYRLELSVTGEDVVTVAAGTYRAWRIEPRVWKLGSGADTRLQHATIWVSDDAAHIPVRIRSEVFVGAVNCDLLRMQTSAKAS